MYQRGTFDLGLEPVFPLRESKTVRESRIQVLDSSHLVSLDFNR